MSRKSRVTADVTLEAHNMLRDYCEKHERSKGFLIEKMIRKFCGGEVEATAPTTANIATVKEKPTNKPSKRFVPPRVDEVSAYMLERTNQLTNGECDKFCDFYESNGWKVGKNKMKCWKAAVRNWLKGNNNGSTKNSSQKLSAHERTKQRNDAKYRQPDECGLGVGANDGHMGGAVDEGERGATIEHVDTGTFIDYE